MKYLKRCAPRLALCLSLVMLFSAFPAVALAETSPNGEPAPVLGAGEDTTPPAVEEDPLPADPEDESGDAGDSHTGEELPEPGPAPDEPGEESGEEPGNAGEAEEEDGDPTETSEASPGGKDTETSAPEAADSSQSTGAQTAAPAQAPARASLAGLNLLDELDALGAYDADHLQALIDEASGTLVLDGDFVLDKTVNITKPLTLGGDTGNTYTISLDPNFHGRHFSIDSSAGLVQLQFLNIVGHGLANGGGVDHTGSGGMKVQAVSFTNNSVGANGGGIASTGSGPITLTSCTFDGNMGVNGGGVYTEGDLVVEQGSVFSGNQATGSGGGAWAASLYFDNSQFYNNYAGSDGGAIYVWNINAAANADVSRLYGGYISNNQAGGNGGGVAFAAAGRHRLNYIEISDNRATNGGGLWMSDDFGGTLYVSAGAVISSNQAANRGGGAYGGNWFYAEKGAVIQNNAAAYGGGAISSWGMYVSDSSFIGNTATKAGGGIYMMSPEGILSLQNSSVTHNSTDGLTGGGIYLTYYTNIYTLYCEFANNHSARGVYWDINYPAGEEQRVAAELYGNDILHTTVSAPFTNIFNDWDVSFFFTSTTPDITVYEVRFEPNGGVWQGGAGDYLIRHVEEGSLAVLPAPITKDGEAPTGWYTDPALKNEWDFDTDTVQGDMTLYAKWPDHTVYDWAVTYHYNDEGNTPDQTVSDWPSDELLAEPATPTWGGNIFVGWYTDEALTTQWDFSKDYLTADTDLYARWRDDPDYVDITFINYGAVYKRYDDIRTSLVFAAPDPAPTATGYILVGWFTEAGDEWLFETGADNDLTLYARWRDDQLVDIVYIDGNTEYARVMDYPEGLLLKEPSPPEHPGEYFLGWYSKPDGAGGDRWDFTTGRAREDMTLYAHYRPLEYFTVTYMDGDTELDELTNVPENSLLTEPAQPTPPDDDAVFGGWYTDEDCTSKWDFASSLVTEDTTLYARWRDDGLVDVDYMADGSLYAHEDDLEPGTRLTEPTEDPQKDGKIFVGWFTEETGGVEWDFSSPATDDMVLYARWRDPDSFSVTYMTDKDTLYDIYTGVTEGSHLAAPRDPRKADSLFGGWYTDLTFTTQWDFYNDTIEGDMTLYARWRGDGLVDIVFMDRDTVHLRYDDHDPAKLVKTPASPENEGYILEGWYTEDEGGRKWNFAADYPTADTTLYARWVIDPATVAPDGFDVIYIADGKEHHRESGLIEGAFLKAPGDPVKTGHSFAGWYRGSESDLPSPAAPASASTSPGLAAAPLMLASPLALNQPDDTFTPLAAITPVFWVFDTDAMPGETLVLVAWFVEGSIDNGGGGGTGPGDTGGPTSTNTGPGRTINGTIASGGSGADGSAGAASAGTANTGAAAYSRRRGALGSAVALTGDTASTALWVLGAAIAIAIGALFVLVRRRKKQK